MSVGRVVVEMFANPCTFCGNRMAIAPGFDRESERVRHEQVCELSIDCPTCKANVGQRCVIRKTGASSPTHQTRRSWAAWGHA